jgi:nucleoid DNA-binding protein
MATATKSPKNAPAKNAAKTGVAKTAPAPLKPIKTAFNKTGLTTHLAEQAGIEPKVAKAVLAALEAAMVVSLSKKGLGEFTLPGLLKVTALNVPAKKKRFGKDPFTGEERWFAPKPASVKIRTRALKKLKDAAL